MQTFFEYTPEVQQALAEKKPVLALESTLITHGLPHPVNLETAQAIEEIVREHNVVPATIAIMRGKIKIGLSQQELEHLVQDKNCVKASRRDIPTLLSQKANAGTTVAATLFCAAHAGIHVFATGGIGGVHRGDAQDVSADLLELARTPIAVICAGAKAVLDLPKTLEFLETQSVPVVGFNTDTLPAFYSAQTEHKLPHRANNVTELVAMLRIHWQLKMQAGFLITNPVPLEHEIPAQKIEPIIADAIIEANQQGITGNALTPFLLKKVASVTKGESLKANIALIKNNVRLGAHLAHALVYIPEAFHF